MGQSNSSLGLEKMFGDELRKARRKALMSQEDLAFRSGLHRTYISLLERGERHPSLDTLFRVAQALQVAPAEMVDQIAKAMPSGRAQGSRQKRKP